MSWIDLIQYGLMWLVFCGYGDPLGFVIVGRFACSGLYHCWKTLRSDV